MNLSFCQVDQGADSFSFWQRTGNRYCVAYPWSMIDHFTSPLILPTTVQSLDYWTDILLVKVFFAQFSLQPGIPFCFGEYVYFVIKL